MDSKSIELDLELTYFLITNGRHWVLFIYFFDVDHF